MLASCQDRVKPQTCFESLSLSEERIEGIEKQNRCRPRRLRGITRQSTFIWLKIKKLMTEGGAKEQMIAVLSLHLT